MQREAERDAFGSQTLCCLVQEPVRREIKRRFARLLRTFTDENGDAVYKQRVRDMVRGACVGSLGRPTAGRVREGLRVCGSTGCRALRALLYSTPRRLPALRGHAERVCLPAPRPNLCVFVVALCVLCSEQRHPGGQLPRHCQHHAGSGHLAGRPPP